MISETFIFISCHVWMVKLFSRLSRYLFISKQFFSWCLQIRSWLWIFLLLLSSPPSPFLSSLPGCRPHDNKRWTFSYGMWNRWSRWEITRNLFCSRRKKTRNFCLHFFSLLTLQYFRALSCWENVHNSTQNHAKFLTNFYVFAKNEMK